MITILVRGWSATPHAYLCTKCTYQSESLQKIGYIWSTFVTCHALKISAFSFCCVRFTSCYPELQQHAPWPNKGTKKQKKAGSHVRVFQDHLIWCHCIDNHPMPLAPIHHLSLHHMLILARQESTALPGFTGSSSISVSVKPTISWSCLLYLSQQPFSAWHTTCKFYQY